MSAGAIRCPLVTDGGLQLDVEAGLAPLVERWLPDPLPPDAGGRIPDPARIRVTPLRVTPLRDSVVRRSDAEGDVLVRLGTVSGRWAGEEREDRGSVELRGSSGVAASVDLERRSAIIGVPPDGGRSELEWDLHHTLTLSAAILLARLGRALVHAAAVVAPDDRAWLLVGDTHSGKTTTAVNLIAAGWDFISDDQVILSPDESCDRPRVEGWLRPFHLDAGWDGGTPGGDRRDFDPGRVRGGRHRFHAESGGLLFPRVVPDDPTALQPLSGGKALSLLIRQTPWLFLDRKRAPELLRLLTDMAEGRRYRLRLGLDTYRDGERLLEVLSPALAERAG